MTSCQIVAYHHHQDVPQGPPPKDVEVALYKLSGQQGGLRYELWPDHPGRCYYGTGVEPEQRSLSMRSST